MSDKICIRCKEEKEDQRTIFMSCFYDMSELNIPLEMPEGSDSHFIIKVCKECRAEWLATIKMWFECVPKNRTCGSGIFIRQLGGNFEITEEEFQRRHPDREPVRIKNDNEI